jgi:hypothetical protein
VLVVVKNRNLHPLAQLALHVEAVGRLDVFKVDSAEGGLQRGDHFHQLDGVFLVDLDVEHINTGKLFEQYALALHHRLGSQWADIAKAEHCRAVGDDAHQIAARGVLEGVDGVLDDFFAGSRYAW